MSDHDELRALLQRFSRAVDQRDVEGLARLFHPDAVIAGARGAQTLEEWLESMRQPRAFPTSMHVLGEPLVDMPGGETARLDTYAVVYQLGEPAGAAGDLTLGVRYLDEVARHEGRWVFLRRSAQTLWMR